jgi:anti-anti-sigma factor
MKVTHEAQGPVDVFRTSGRLDYTATAGDFDRRLRAPFERDPMRRFPVLELSGVTLLGSQALRGIIALAKDLKGQSGQVYVCAPSSAAEEALKVSGFSQLKIYEFHDDMKDAVIAATLAARKAPAIKTDDPFYVPPPPPEPPPPPGGVEKVLAVAKKTVTGIGKVWNALAMQLQKLLDKKAKK